MVCEHRNYKAAVRVFNMEDSGARMAEIRIRCAECDLPMEFVGVPVGCEFYRVTSDLSAQCLNAPIVPLGERQKQGLIGYSLNIIGDDGT